MFVSIGHDVSDFQAALQTTHCHLQINNMGMNNSLLPAWIIFYRFSYLTRLISTFQSCPVMNKRLNKKNKIKKTTLPVSYVAGVKLKLIIIPQQSLLDMTEIHRLPVDGYEPHTPLEGRSQVLTVHGGAAWREKTHDATFRFTACVCVC